MFPLNVVSAAGIAAPSFDYVFTPGRGFGAQRGYNSINVGDMVPDVIIDEPQSAFWFSLIIFGSNTGNDLKSVFNIGGSGDRPFGSSQVNLTIQGFDHTFNMVWNGVSEYSSGALGALNPGFWNFLEANVGTPLPLALEWL